MKKILKVGWPGVMSGLKAYIANLLTIQPANLIGLWDFQDLSGSVVKNHAARETSAAVELLIDGGFEVAGGGGADVFRWWLEGAGDGAIANEASLVHGGAHALKLTSGPNANTQVGQLFLCTPGKEITFSFWTRGDGTHGGRYYLVNANPYGIAKALAATGITGTDYELFTFTYTPPAGVNEVILRLYGPAENGGIAYFDDASAMAVADCTAGYSENSTTYQQAGPPLKGVKYSVKFLGASSAAYLGSGGYNNLADHDTGSAIGWGKVNAGTVWTDGSMHRYLWHPKDKDDASWYLVFGKYMDTNNSVFWRRRAGPAANSNEQIYTFGSPPLGWFCMGMSWDITVPRLKGYLYVPGELAWLKVFDVAGVNMDTMAGRDFKDPYNTFLMAGGQNSQLWQGWGGVTAQWAGLALSDDEMQLAMTGR